MFSGGTCVLHGCQRPGAGCLEALGPPPWDVALGSWGRARSWAPKALSTPVCPLAFWVVSLSSVSSQYCSKLRFRADHELWACGTQHSNISPYFPPFSRFRKQTKTKTKKPELKQWQEHLLFTSCFVYRKLTQADSKCHSIFHMQWVKLLANSTVSHQMNQSSGRM